MADEQQAEDVKELRLIRGILFGLLVFGFCALALETTKMIFPGPGAN